MTSHSPYTTHWPAHLDSSVTLDSDHPNITSSQVSHIALLLDVKLGHDTGERRMHRSYPGVIQVIPVLDIVWKTLILSIVILVSLVGNALVIYVVARTQRMHTATNYFIVNLAVSDVMVTLFCTWVRLVDELTEGWVLGAFFCKMNSFTQVLSLVTSILTLTLISLDRFFGIVFAMKAHVTERRSSLFIALVWATAGAISAPLLVYRQQGARLWTNHDEIWCDDEWPAVVSLDDATGVMSSTSPLRTAYYTFVSVVLFFAPIVVMSAAYVVIIVKLWSSEMPGERVESEIRSHDKIKKKVIVMLVILLCVFVVCWLPLQVSILYVEHRAEIKEIPDWHKKFSFFAHLLAYSNSALNPIVYTGFNENFRKGFKNALLCCRKKPLTTYSSRTVTTAAGAGANSVQVRTLCYKLERDCSANFLPDCTDV